VRAYERTVTDDHVGMYDAERLDRDIAADDSLGAYDAGRMNPTIGHRTMIGGLSEQARRFGRPAS
jgi:hypothetical protein